MKRSVIGAVAILLLVPALACADDAVGEVLRKARASLDAGQIDRAVKLLETARKEHPGDPRPYPLLAFLLYAKKGEVRRPAYLLISYLEHEWGDTYSTRLLGEIASRALDQGRPRLAQEAFGFLTRHGVDDSATLYGWAQASRKLGKFDAARNALLRVIDRNPTDRHAYTLLAEVYLDSGQYEKAASTYRQMLVQWPGDVRIRLHLGNLLLWDLRDYAAAEKEFGLAIALCGPASEIGREVRRALQTARSMKADALRLRRRNSLLGWLLAGVVALYTVLFLGAAFLTRPRCFAGDRL